MTHTLQYVFSNHNDIYIYIYICVSMYICHIICNVYIYIYIIHNIKIVIRRFKRNLVMYIRICEYSVIVIHVCIRTTLSYKYIYIYYTNK